jgi:hypothetical protein
LSGKEKRVSIHKIIVTEGKRDYVIFFPEVIEIAGGRKARV